MTVKLIVQAEVKGAAQVNNLKAGLKGLGTQALIAKKKLAALEAGAARSRATFAALGTTLRVGVGVGLAAVTLGLGKFVKDTFAAGKLTESLQVRFKLLFGSVKEGGKAFKVMNDFAAKVPFSLEAIAAGSGNLAVISKDSRELNKILEVTGNVAASTGLDFAITATQIQRAFAGGIASADVFRERGVRAMLGFEAGATVSIEETRKRFFEVFANGGKYSKATKDFENTLEAQVSFVQDAYFRFRQAAAKPLFGGLKKQLIELVGNFKENDAQLKALAVRVGKGLSEAFSKLGKAIKFLFNNFDKIVTAFKTFIKIKIIGFIAGLVFQFGMLVVNIRAAGGAMAALNVAMSANALGLLITGIQISVVAWMAFEDQIKSIYYELKFKFQEAVLNALISMKEFRQSIFGLGSKANLQNIKELKEQIISITTEFNNIKNKKIEIDFVVPDQIDLEEEHAQMLEEMEQARIKAAIEAEKALKQQRADQIAAVEEHVEWLELEKEIRLEGIKRYREQLAAVGIESKAIGSSIADTWVNGLKAGNSLLQITKDSFKNVLQMVAEQMLRKTIEYGVELLFVALLGNKVDKEKEITAEKKKQFTWALLTAGISGSGFGSFLNFNKGGVVPGGAPYTDRVPAMLTPGEVVIPRNKVGQQSGNTNITNINISGNVDQRSIDQIKGVISSASAEVGGANKAYTKNTQGVRGRNI